MLTYFFAYTFFDATVSDMVDHDRTKDLAVKSKILPEPVQIAYIVDTYLVYKTM